MTLRAYKYRLYPTVSQQNQLNQTFGSVRFVWNKLVDNFNSWSPDNKPCKLTHRYSKQSSLDANENITFYERLVISL